jgi:transcription antitermination protein NusB
VTPPRGGGRRAARRYALLALYSSDLTGGDAAVLLRDAAEEDERELDPYAVELVAGVTRARPELDAAIGEAAEEWSVDRLAALDRAILRLAAYELLHREDVPVGAAIDEAVEAAKELSTEESGRFVNGVLATIARTAGRTGNA